MFNLLYNRFPRELADPKRFRVESMEEMFAHMNKYNGKRRIFVSVYNWDSKVREIVLDKIWFDLDSPSCLENTKKLHEWCMKKNYKHMMVFSGRGFHFYLLTKNYSSLNDPKRTLYNCHKHIAKEVGLSIGEGDTFDIDWHIVGDVRRVATIPETWNNKRQRYAMCITEDDLNKKYETIRGKAKSQYLGGVVYGEEGFDVKPFDCLIKEFSSPLQYECDSLVEINKDEALKNLPLCIKVWLSREHVGWKRRGWITMWLRSKGLWREKLKEPMPAMYEEARSLLRQYLTKEEFEHMNSHEDGFQLRYLFFHNNKNSFPTCENIKAMGECPIEGNKCCKEKILFGENGGK